MSFDLHALDLIGARLRPGAISRVVEGAEAARLVGVAAPLSDLQPKRSVLMALAETLQRLTDEAARLAALGQALERLLLPVGVKRSTLLATELTAALSAPGTRCSLDEQMAQIALVGARQGRRLIRRETGLSPKGLARVVRFQHALQEMIFFPTRSLATVAAMNGYCDQAHLARESLAFSGLSPSRLRLL
jgi:AraC-like DNA-binding protein